MHKITNYREVKYDFDTKLDAFHWDEFMREVNYTTFDALGDYYAVYENLDEPDDHDRKKYAVYLHSTGELICLMADCGCALDCCYADEEYVNVRNELYKQIAMLAGWPEKISTKNRYTVRINRIMDVEVLADNKEQACTIGRELAFRANHVNNDYGNRVRIAMASNEFEFADAWDAPSDEDGVWDMALNECECEQLLNKED